MSLDVYLELNGETVYRANITHNLNKMAMAAGCYEVLWRPDEEGFTTAHQLVEGLEKGLLNLLSNPPHFEKLNPPNGWGRYDGLVNFIVEYIKACRRFPFATVEVSR